MLTLTGYSYHRFPAAGHEPQEFKKIDFSRRIFYWQVE
jgi:hypothetical protein